MKANRITMDRLKSGRPIYDIKPYEIGIPKIVYASSGSLAADQRYPNKQEAELMMFDDLLKLRT